MSCTAPTKKELAEKNKKQGPWTLGAKTWIAPTKEEVAERNKKRGFWTLGAKIFIAPPPIKPQNEGTKEVILSPKLIAEDATSASATRGD